MHYIQKSQNALYSDVSYLGTERNLSKVHNLPKVLLQLFNYIQQLSTHFGIRISRDSCEASLSPWKRRIKILRNDPDAGRLAEIHPGLSKNTDIL